MEDKELKFFGYEKLLDLEKLKTLAETKKESYKEARPFAHGVFDDMFDETVLDMVLKEFEEADGEWKSFDTKYEKKLQLNQEEQMGPVTRAFIHSLNSAPFLNFLEELTGIKGLIPDPHLMGGGLHKIPRGGKLGIHVDFNQYKKLNAYRRLNVLVYLNKDWKEEYGGHFELWGDKQGSEKVKVLPIFNRMAMFTTTSSSFHGHPEPLNCPENRARRSLALYYYTAGEQGEQRSKEHSTIFLDERGREDELGKQTSLQKAKGTVKKLIGL